MNDGKSGKVTGKIMQQQVTEQSNRREEHMFKEEFFRQRNSKCRGPAVGVGLVC